MRILTLSFFFTSLCGLSQQSGTLLQFSEIECFESCHFNGYDSLGLSYSWVLLFSENGDPSLECPPDFFYFNEYGELTINKTYAHKNQRVYCDTMTLVSAELTENSTDGDGSYRAIYITKIEIVGDLNSDISSRKMVTSNLRLTNGNGYSENDLHIEFSNDIGGTIQFKNPPDSPIRFNKAVDYDFYTPDDFYLNKKYQVTYEFTLVSSDEGSVYETKIISIEMVE